MFDQPLIVAGGGSFDTRSNILTNDGEGG